MIIDRDIYDKVCEITTTGYDPLIETDKEVLLSANSIMSMLEELMWEVDSQKEKVEDLEQDIEDNYKPISRSEYTGDSYDDRY